MSASYKKRQSGTQDKKLDPKSEKVKDVVREQTSTLIQRLKYQAKGICKKDIDAFKTPIIQAVLDQSVSETDGTCTIDSLGKQLKCTEKSPYDDDSTFQPTASPFTKSMYARGHGHSKDETKRRKAERDAKRMRNGSDTDQPDQPDQPDEQDEQDEEAIQAKHEQAILDRMFTLTVSGRKMTFKTDFNQKLEKSWFQTFVKTIIFGKDFNTSIVQGVIPDGATDIRFGDRFDQTIDNDVLPKKLTKLKFGEDFKSNLDFLKELDVLEELTLGDNYRWEDISKEVRSRHFTLYCSEQCIRDARRIRASTPINLTLNRKR